MYKKKKYFIFIISVIFYVGILNCVSTFANPDASYVNIENNDEFIWLIEIDEEKMENFYLDIGLNISDIEWDEDWDAIKFVILSIYEEEDHSGYDGVKVVFNYYSTEDRASDTWKLETSYAYTIIYNYDKDDNDVIELYQSAAFWGAFFIAIDVDWEKVMGDYDEDLGNSGSASYDNNQIRIEIDPSYMNNTEKIKVSNEYNSDGVIVSYELEYGEDTLVTGELEGQVYDTFWIWVIGIIIIVAVIGGIILFLKIIIPTHEKPGVKVPEVKKEEGTAQTPILEGVKESQKEIKKEEGAAQVPLLEEGKESQKAMKKEIIRFCPYCGNLVAAKANYCNTCGSSLKE